MDSIRGELEGEVCERINIDAQISTFDDAFCQTDVQA